MYSLKKNEVLESTKLFGLIGNPLTHSFSKGYFAQKFEKENLSNCQYELYPLDSITELPALIAAHPTLLGLNVTIPYKESVLPFLNKLDDTAAAVGAVNCIKILRNDADAPVLVGYNTDVIGFRKSIRPFLEMQHERALIVGTGGASKAVAYVLKEIGIDCYFVTRNKETKSGSNYFTYQELNQYVINAFKLIVNTSPVGMYPHVHAAPELPYQFITPGHLLYDLVYNPIETQFLKQGKLQGAAVVNGLSMLHLQAEEGWKIWNDLNFN